MLLSIIIPAYNAEKYIEKCLTSVISDNSNIEVIVVNDGSTDKTEEICKKYIENIKYIYIENHGVSYARNLGIKSAKGKWIMFVDADDYLAPDWWQIIEKNIDIEKDLVFFEKNIDINKKYNDLEIIESILGISSGNIRLFSSCSKLYKKEKLEKNGIMFDEDIINGEDMMFVLNNFLHSSNIKMSNGSFYNYRVHGNSSSHNFNEKILNSEKKVIMNIERYLSDSNLSSGEIKSIVNQWKSNSLLTLMNRLELSFNYAKAKKYFYMFNDGVYKDINYMGQHTLKSVVSKMIYNKNYLMSYMIFKFRNYITKIKEKEDIVKL